MKQAGEAIGNKEYKSYTVLEYIREKARIKTSMKLVEQKNLKRKGRK